MTAALRTLMFVGRQAEADPEPTSGLRTVDRATLESPVSPVAESVAPPAAEPGPVQPGLYMVRRSVGTPIWVHVTPD